MSENFYFRVEVEKKYGLGHLIRCLVLASHLKSNGATCTFITPSNASYAISLVNEYGFRIVKVPSECSLNEEIVFYPLECHHLIIDVFHIDQRKNEKLFTSYIESLVTRGMFIIFIDALFEEACNFSMISKVPVVIQPYLGAEEDRNPGCKYWLKGGQYSLLSDVYNLAKQEEVRFRVENVLITFGGSDRQGLTEVTVEALLSLDNPIRFRIVVGPGFTKEDQDTLEKICSRHKSRTYLIVSPDNLLEHYLWADLVLTGSGQTRYECSVLGIPMIFVALYQEHIKSCKFFSSNGNAVFLGLASEIIIDKLKEVFLELDGDFDRRVEMSKMSQKLIDGRGAERLSTQLLEIVKREERNSN